MSIARRLLPWLRSANLRLMNVWVGISRGVAVSARAAWRSLAADPIAWSVALGFSLAFLGILAGPIEAAKGGRPSALLLCAAYVIFLTYIGRCAIMAIRWFAMKSLSTSGGLYLGALGVALGLSLIAYGYPRDTYVAPTPQGGLAILSHDPTMKLDVHVYDVSWDYISEEQVIRLEVVATGSGANPSLAFVASGNAYVSTAGLVDGIVVEAQTPYSKGEARSISHIVAELPPVSTKPFEVASGGIAIDRSNFLELPSPWYDSTRVSSFVLRQSNPDGGDYSLQETLVMRLQRSYQDDHGTGSLGEVGCPSQLYSVANQAVGKQRSLAMASLPGNPGWAAPETCDIHISLFQVSNATVEVNGNRSEDGLVQFAGKSSYVANLGRSFVGESHLTIPRTSYHIEGVDAAHAQRVHDFVTSNAAQAGVAILVASIALLASGISSRRKSMKVD